MTSRTRSSTRCRFGGPQVGTYVRVDVLHEQGPECARAASLLRTASAVGRPSVRVSPVGATS